MTLLRDGEFLIFIVPERATGKSVRPKIRTRDSSLILDDRDENAPGTREDFATASLFNARPWDAVVKRAIKSKDPEPGNFSFLFYSYFDPHGLRYWALNEKNADLVKN